MNIISSSRRTDIPAFYLKWFLNRIKAGYVKYPNPFSKEIYEISLKPEDVQCIVFWSKDYRLLLPHLEKELKPYNKLFQFTITGHPEIFEPRVPPVEDAIKTAHTLANLYSPEYLFWRFDPIILSDITSPKYYPKKFAHLCKTMQGATGTCTISFVDITYNKVKRNLLPLNLGVYDAGVEEKKELAEKLAEIAKECGIQLLTCCGNYLISDNIKKASCVDGELISRLFPDAARKVSKRPTRKECGCYESKDIGRYDTCLHGCPYCYATVSKERAKMYYQSHNPDADML